MPIAPAVASLVSVVVLLIGAWFGVRAMIKLDSNQRRRLAERHGVSIDVGARGHWRVTGGLDTYAGSKLWLHLLVFLTQFGIWMGFAVVLLAILSALAGLGYLFRPM